VEWIATKLGTLQGYKMQNRATRRKIKAVLGNPDLAGIILSYNREYCHFRLTCKYMYTSVESMSFGLKLKWVNSFKPNSFNEFFYNHPYLAAGTMVFCFGSLGGSNIILLPALSFMPGMLSTFSYLMFMNIALELGQTNLSQVVNKSFHDIKSAFAAVLKNNIIRGGMGFFLAGASGVGCTLGLGGVAGLVHKRCDNVFEQGIATLAAGAAIAGFFAHRHAVKSNLKKREEKKNEIHKEFFKHKVT